MDEVFGFFFGAMFTVILALILAGNADVEVPVDSFVTAVNLCESNGGIAKFYVDGVGNNTVKCSNGAVLMFDERRNVR